MLYLSSESELYFLYSYVSDSSLGGNTTEFGTVLMMSSELCLVCLKGY